ncbi:hypothetical protein C5B42_04140 [Candidatus Cerribacteria bacterium 'Amazon FNV 2010 28 9']|uniref:Pseudouridine synthase n=1 Tax=Candidatus Cerribacteria bacterium 'Amazon FNV 2010 28 9' TaxID=2081795 RepID=A0A317JN12_9BACT|nr:MAG: hypothetical protein C5B42_04140 [Candidatus Cerribacteria bacterium 'Amazon FNV 2010 28 9']
MNAQELESAILFEDDYILVLNKPAGWVVNRANTYTELTVQEWMEERLGVREQGIGNKERTNELTSQRETPYGTPEEIFTQRGGIVHRLDKDTSGVLLLAKTPDVLVELLRQFRERETQKEYIALVHGKLVPSFGSIRLPMDRSSEDRKKFAIDPNGRMSETEYKLIEFFPGLPRGISQKKGKSYQGFSLTRLHPKTGRTHQIRVHMAAIKHPLVGDGVYAGKKRIVLDKEWCPRQFLHAAKLVFTHPINKERVCFEAPLAKDLQIVLEKLHPTQ